jgi:tetratricopeptide (TPR) repeat protein
MIATTTTQREMIHWIWLWTLAAIVVSVMQGNLAGQEPGAKPVDQGAQAEPSLGGGVDAGQPIPMPNVDNPEWFRYPDEPARKLGERVSLSELLLLHRLGNFDRALDGWKAIEPQTDSLTWQQVGLGVALMRLDRMDEALSHMEKATALEPNNAVAEYFLARIRQAQGRMIPYWHDEPRGNAPYRLASVVEPSDTAGLEPVESRARSRSEMLLPHFIDDAYGRLARKHFRRALMLAPKCDLEQVIRVVAEEEPVLQLAQQRFDGPPNATAGVTVGDLLDSWGERDFVRKSKAELGVRPRHQLSGAISAMLQSDLPSPRSLQSLRDGNQ